MAWRLTANEGWWKYTTLIGPVATFGYWIGSSVVLSFLGLFTGHIAQAAWFPKEPYGTDAFGGEASMTFPAIRNCKPSRVT